MLPGEVLRTKDGQLWDKRSLYVKAIELDLGCGGEGAEWA